MGFRRKIPFRDSHPNGTCDEAERISNREIFPYRAHPKVLLHRRTVIGDILSLAAAASNDRFSSRISRSNSAFAANRFIADFSLSLGDLALSTGWGRCVVTSAVYSTQRGS